MSMHGTADIIEHFVRVASPDDEMSLMAMLKKMHAEGGFRDVHGNPHPISLPKVQATVHRAVLETVKNLTEVGATCCGVIGEPGRVEASLCLAVGTTWYSDYRFLGDMWTFVMPDFRTQPHFRLLLTFAKHVADRTQMDMVLGNVSSERTSAKDRFLQQFLGAEKYGSWFLYHPQPAQPPGEEATMEARHG